MDLLILTEETEEGEVKNHYLLIKDFNRLMYNKTKNKDRKHFCMYCLQYFSSDRVLNKRKDNCLQLNGAQQIRQIVLRYNRDRQRQQG